MDTRKKIGKLLQASLIVRNEIEVAAKAANRDSMSRAKALIFSQTLDLVAGYGSLLMYEPSPLMSRAIILRAIIESHANWNHISEKESRAVAFLNNSRTIARRIGDYIDSADNKKPLSEPKSWTTCSSKDRVVKLGEGTDHVYDYLSNFVHGNNIADSFMDKKELQRFSNLFNESAVAQFIMLLCRQCPELSAPKHRLEKVMEAIEIVQGKRQASSS